MKPNLEFWEQDKEESKKIMFKYSGKIIEHQCYLCGGSGFVQRTDEYGEPCPECSGKGSIKIQW